MNIGNKETNTLFKNNKVSNTNSGSSAGALSNYSKVVFGKNTHTVFQNNEVVAGNSYARGGAIYNAGGTAEIKDVIDANGELEIDDKGNPIKEVTYNYGITFEGDTTFIID